MLKGKASCFRHDRAVTGDAVGVEVAGVVILSGLVMGKGRRVLRRADCSGTVSQTMEVYPATPRPGSEPRNRAHGR